MMNPKYLAYLFYGIGSLCFLIGTLIAIYQIWKQDHAYYGE